MQQFPGCVEVQMLTVTEQRILTDDGSATDETVLWTRGIHTMCNYGVDITQPNQGSKS